MALWRHCGTGWTRASWAHGGHDTPALLCCPGPSLADVPAELRGLGRAVWALNTAYPRVQPDVWIGMDRPDCYDRNLWREPFVKVCRGSYGGEIADGRALREWPTVCLADCEDATVGDAFTRRAHDVKFCWHSHTLGVALHALVWAGYRRIYLVGCDLGGAADYWDGQRLTDEQRARNRRLYGQQVGFLRDWAAAGKTAGVELWSATPDSPANTFLPTTTVAEVLQRYGRRTDPGPRVYCTEAAPKPEPLTVACVMRSGGWCTPEYVHRLRDGVGRHLRTPHRFACLTDMPHAIECETIRLAHDWPNWWSKIELFRAFRQGRTLYMDLDTVVNGDLSAVAACRAPFAMIRDRLFPDYLASGVMTWQGDYSRIYDKFASNPAGTIAAYPAPTGPATPAAFARLGDQAYIRDTLGAEALTPWDAAVPGVTVTSWKADNYYVRRKSAIICYHGSPRPHETNWSI